MVMVLCAGHNVWITGNGANYQNYIVMIEIRFSQHRIQCYAATLPSGVRSIVSSTTQIISWHTGCGARDQSNIVTPLGTSPSTGYMRWVSSMQSLL